MIKAVIFDLNGIFLQSPKLSVRFEKDFGISNEIFKSKLFNIMDALRKPGAGPAFSYWKPALDEWKINLSEQEFWKYWFGAEVQSDKMISFAKSLREKGIKVFILSNNFKERAEYYGHYPWIHEAVDKVYFSFQTGFIKPDTRAWELILSENDLKIEECLYFDDQERNLKASMSIGIQAFKFTNEEDTEKQVRNLLHN